ncbi:centrosomal protein 43 isoform X2 [Hydra vulgaris]|uniref:FGFR1 oncogene partner n=1 Tax=Hydra vulgaris TaxID=6087 RepID=T2MHP4_HYDVU|nr:centrosomal protein 43 isoform X2 [Hydra vulgaris]
MSAEEDTELRDLVAETLERNGVLNKIRAELRANVFIALEEQNSNLQKKTVSNKEFKAFLETNEGRQVFSLVREFLEFFHLDFTLAVFDPESDFIGKALSRETLCTDFSIPSHSNSPLLAEVLKKKVGGKSVEHVKPYQSKGKSVEHQSKEKKIKSYNFEDDDDLDDERDLLKDLGVMPASYNILNTNQKNKSNRLDPISKWIVNDDPKSDSQKVNDLKSNSKHSVSEIKDDKILEVTKDTKNSKGLKLKESDYEDDFQVTSSQKSDGLSISEELDDDLSIGSFAGSKADDILTTDQTVSQLSGVGFDYGEDAESQ